MLRVLNLIVNIFVFTLIITFLFIKFFYATIVTLRVLGNSSCSTISIFKLKTKVISQKYSKAREITTLGENTPLFNIKSVKIFNSGKVFL